MDALRGLIATSKNSFEIYQKQLLSNQLFSAYVVRPHQLQFPKVSPDSLFFRPISYQSSMVRGTNRNWGAAPASVQIEVMKNILDLAKARSLEDRATLLAMARLESGFNPDAAATSSSAAGVFQLINKTALSLGLSNSDVFDAKLNIEAGIKLLDSNRQIFASRYKGLNLKESIALDYALHHDGPSLQYGGLELAEREVLPYWQGFLSLVKKYEDSQNGLNALYPAAF